MINTRRVISPEETEIIKQEAERKEREARNKKIRCPACRKTQYFNNYFANSVIGALVCPKCGVLFVDQAKLKIIKHNIEAEKKKQTLIIQK
jgi:late competence protein required for DNA uptake (superfamily II DNA/RNA helicase)